MANRGTDPSRIGQIPLFEDVGDDVRRRLADAAADVSIAAGEDLFRLGEPATHFYFVESGCVQLSRTSPGGDEKVIAVVEPGRTFGEALMFKAGDHGYPVNARAIQDTGLIAFAMPGVRAILRESAETCFAIMASMSVRLHELVIQIDEITLHNATYRLVNYLLDQLPAEAEHARDIQLAIPKLVIASRLSIQPETFSRILARLRRDGLIDAEGAHIVLKDVPGLERLVE